MRILFPPTMPVETLDSMRPSTSLSPGTEALLSALSGPLMAEDSTALKALGFWLRPAHLQQMRELAVSGRMRPRGRVVQVAPGNVDTLFIYVSLLALWMGNVVIVRLSSRQGEDERRLLAVLEALYAEARWQASLDRLILLRCDYGDDLWAAQMASADMRIFWGSDNTLQSLSQSPKSAQCIDLGMGHKHSLSLIRAGTVLEEPQGQWASLFVRDTLEFSQQGCASPRTLVWYGEPAQVRRAQAIFWPEIHRAVKDLAAAGRYQQSDAEALERLLRLQQLALDGTIDQPWQLEGSFVRLPVTGLDVVQEQGHPAHGVVYEWQITALDELAAQLRPWHQTLSFFGWSRDALVDWAVAEAVPGLDRIEPLGQALAFHPVWDGLNLMQQLGRQLR